MGRLDDIRQNSGLAKCDRCGFTFPVDELVEEEETGAIVDPKCLDKTGFNKMKQDNERESVSHHFTT